MCIQRPLCYVVQSWLVHIHDVIKNEHNSWQSRFKYFPCRLTAATLIILTITDVLLILNQKSQVLVSPEMELGEVQIRLFKLRYPTF